MEVAGMKGWALDDGAWVRPAWARPSHSAPGSSRSDIWDPRTTTPSPPAAPERSEDPGALPDHLGPVGPAYPSSVAIVDRTASALFSSASRSASVSSTSRMSSSPPSPSLQGTPR